MNEDLASMIREHAPFIWRALRHLGVPEAQLEDLCQDVCIVIVRKLGQFESRSLLRTWIFGICRNVARNAARQRARARESLPERFPEVAVPEQQSRVLVQRQAQALLRDVLQSLPEPTRMVFVLFEIESMPMNEVASMLGCTSSTAYSRLYAARGRVHAALEHAGLIEPGQKLAEVI